MNHVQESWYSKIIRLVEALELSTAKLYTQIGKDAREDEIQKKVFEEVIDPLWEKVKKAGEFTSKRGDRVYFPFQADKSSITNSALDSIYMELADLTGFVALGLEAQNPNSTILHTVYREVGEEALPATPENIFDEVFGAVVDHVRQALLKDGAEKVVLPVGEGVIDFIDGTVALKGRITKIGKVLEMLINKKAIPSRYVPSVRKALTAYNTLRTQQGYTKTTSYYIAVSRHPVDIAGMSTDRGWTSCMELPNIRSPKGGDKHAYIKCDVEAGTFIAYLIKPQDLNIQRPVARVLIKPHFNYDSSAVYYKLEKDPYPQTAKQFYASVQNLFDKIQPTGGLPVGIYIKDENLYDDSIDFYEGDFRPSTVQIGSLSDIFKSRPEDDESQYYAEEEHFDGMDLRGANFTYALLARSTFTNADLRNANFTDADLDEVSFLGANLSGAVGLDTCMNLDTVKYDEDTIWPEEFNIEDYQ